MDKSTPFTHPPENYKPAHCGKCNFKQKEIKRLTAENKRSRTDLRKQYERAEANLNLAKQYEARVEALENVYIAILPLKVSGTHLYDCDTRLGKAMDDYEALARSQRAAAEERPCFRCGGTGCLECLPSECCSLCGDPDARMPSWYNRCPRCGRELPPIAAAEDKPVRY